MSHQALSGIRVLEVGQLLAGPFAGTLLVLRRRVIKIEPPGEGDPIRHWRLLDKDGTGYWWRSLAETKISNREPAQRRRTRGLKRLMLDADVVIENFKPGTMEKWGLGPEDLKSLNLTDLHAHFGYGQAGPYSRKLVMPRLPRRSAASVT